MSSRMLVLAVVAMPAMAAAQDSRAGTNIAEQAEKTTR